MNKKIIVLYHSMFVIENFRIIQYKSMHHDIAMNKIRVYTQPAVSTLRTILNNICGITEVYITKLWEEDTFFD